MPRLEDYELVRVLAQGGMGVVHEAVERATGRRVALKRILAGALDGDAVARFLLEGRALARLSHPGIVRVHALERAPGGPFMVMDLVQGDSLQRLLEREGPLPPARAVSIARALASALAHAHSNDVLHRDLKPANVLVDERGDVRLIDFGLAKLQLTGGSLAHLTRTGELVGTPAYMAPEQADGRPLDARTDVYGLGATLFALLTGRPPFDGASAIAVLHAVLTREPAPPSRLRPGLSPAIDALVLECLAKDPARRPPSMAALHARLTAVRLGSSTAASPSTSARRAAIVGVAALALAAGGLAFGALAWRRSPIETPAPGGPDPPPAPPDAGTLLAEVARRRDAGDDRGALALLEAGAPAHDDVRLWLERARARARVDGVQAALESPRPGAPPAARLAHARALIAAARFEAADDALGRLDGGEPGVGLARFEVARALGRELTLVRADLERTLDGSPDAADRLLALALFELEGEGTPGAGRALDSARRRLARLGAPAHLARLEAAEEQRRGRADAALTALERAVASGPDDPAVLLERANALLTVGRPEDAERALDRAVHLDPLLARGWQLRAAARMTRRNLDGAASDHARVVRLAGAASARGLDLLDDLGRHLIGRGRPDLALRLLEQAGPDAPHARVLRLEAEARLAAGDRAGAVAAYERLLTTCPPDLGAFQAAGAKLAELGGGQGLDWGDCYLAALARRGPLDERGWQDCVRRLFSANLPVLAERAATRAIELGGGVEVRSMRAQCRTLLEDLVGALADWDVVVAAGPGAWSSRASRADVRYRLGDLIGALEDADHGVALADERHERSLALSSRAHVRERVGDLQGALDDVREAQATYPIDGLDERAAALEPRVAADRAAMALLRDAVREAVKGSRGAAAALPLAERSKANPPVSPRAARVAGWVVRTVARAGLGNNDSHGLLLLADDHLRRAGDDSLRRALEADRAELDALATPRAPVERADLLWRLGRYGAAAALLAELEVESPDPALTLRRADALWRDGDVAGAEAAYRRLVRADAPEALSIRAHRRLAELAIDQGQPTAALIWVDAGCALGQLPPRDVALFELERARALGQLERWPEALPAARAAADGLARAAAEEGDDARAVTRGLRARALAVMGEALAREGRTVEARGLLLEALRAVTPLSLDGFHQPKREVHERALRALPRDREVQRWADLAFP